ncbi:MAG: protein-ADP-ribose hydrolase, partial [Clostridiales bacterium]|nr:protein-ADP-ribose hydrolase [Clostridiales bacterium]
MTQDERRIYLIRALLAEGARYQGMEIPTDAFGQKRLLRALCNVRMPGPVSQDFLPV